MNIFHKLIRDRIPDIVAAKGKAVHTRILNGQEFREALEQKLREEAEELQRAASEEDKKEELADLLEVLDAIMHAYGFSSDDIRCVQKKKRVERGGFEKRIFLESIEG